MKAFENVNVYVYGEGIKKTDIAFDEKIRAIGDARGAEEYIPLPPTRLCCPAL